MITCHPWLVAEALQRHTESSVQAATEVNVGQARAAASSPRSSTSTVGSAARKTTKHAGQEVREPGGRGGGGGGKGCGGRRGQGHTRAARADDGVYGLGKCRQEWSRICQPLQSILPVTRQHDTLMRHKRRQQRAGRYGFRATRIPHLPGYGVAGGGQRRHRVEQSMVAAVLVLSDR